MSLYGGEHDFDGKDTVVGQFQNWRKFQVQNRDEDIARAKKLIRRACENYKRNQGNLDWDESVRVAESRWLEAREREQERAAKAKLYREL